jgi:hypothetical protein
MATKREYELQKQLEQSRKTITGQSCVIKGYTFEQTVMSHFTRDKWVVTQRLEKYGFEYDLYGEKDNFFSTDYLLVECKDKQRVTSGDVNRFIRKVVEFHKRMQGGTLMSYLCYTGEIDADAKYVARINDINLMPCGKK